MPFLITCLLTCLFTERSAFCAAQAQLEDCAVVHVAAGVQVQTPLQVLFCSTAPSASSAPDDEAAAVPSASFPRLEVQLEEGASLHLKQSFVTLPLPPLSPPPSDLPEGVAGSVCATVVASLVASSTRLELAAGAQLQHTYVQELAGEVKGQAGAHLAKD